MTLTAHRRHRQEQRLWRILATILLLGLFLATIYGRAYAQEFLSPEGFDLGAVMQSRNTFSEPMVVVELPITDPYIPTPTPTVVPTKAPTKAFPRNGIVQIVEAAASRYGVSQTLLKAISQCESGFRHDAKAKGSTATGLFQFIRATWMGYVKQRGLDWTLEDRTNPEKNADMAAYVISKGGLSNWTADPRSEACWGWAKHL